MLIGGSDILCRCGDSALYWRLVEFANLSCKGGIFGECCGCQEEEGDEKGGKELHFDCSDADLQMQSLWMTFEALIAGCVADLMQSVCLQYITSVPTPDFKTVGKLSLSSKYLQI